MAQHTLIGRYGEDAVIRYLISHKYTILARNITYRGGEIDIVAQLHNVITFVEVKTRSTTYFHLSSVITPKKQLHIIHAARLYLIKHNIRDNTVIRFDVALVEKDTEDWSITYYPNAFTDHTSIH